jgi:alpha-galactosidase
MIAKTSRRHFVQLTGALALSLRHGLLPAQAAEPGDSSHAAASLEDANLALEWDANLHMRVTRRVGGQRRAMTSWGASDYLLIDDDRHVTDFPIQHKATGEITDINGPGTRLTLTGMSSDGIAKALAITIYERHPGIALLQVSYRNTGTGVLSIRAWTNGDLHVPASGNRTPAFWCYSGASYEDRRNWVQPVALGFEQDNFLGMEASDYGGGTPIVDVWHRDGGVAVGHVETSPRRVSLPVHAERNAVRVAVCGKERIYLRPGEAFDTPQTFVAVHGGDYFAVLNTYRNLMSERGLTPAVPPATSYEPIWCAWGYERSCSTALIEGTLPKVKELGLEWAVIDDGWQAMIGDWSPDRAKYPNGDADMRRLVSDIRAGGLKPRLWFSPLSVAPGSDFLHDHADMLLLDKNGAVQNISWWNSFYLCPGYDKTVEFTQRLVAKFIGEWGFAGLKLDGQHLNNVAPCYNPAHRHARPEESVEGLQTFFAALYQTAMALDPDAVMELCPCGTAYSVFNFPAMNQAPASDPESSWQVRHKGKTLKGLMGPSAPYAGDHVELSDHGDDFASTVGVGAVVSTKFTWPVDPKPKDSFLLTPEREIAWRKWIALYKDKMLPRGVYRGELYDIGFDKPEAHVIERTGRLYYAFYADTWQGDIVLRGLGSGPYRIRDYYNDLDLGTMSSERNRLKVTFQRFLLLEATPA